MNYIGYLNFCYFWIVCVGVYNEKCDKEDLWKQEKNYFNIFSHWWNIGYNTSDCMVDHKSFCVSFTASLWGRLLNQDKARISEKFVLHKGHIGYVAVVLKYWHVFFPWECMCYGERFPIHFHFCHSSSKITILIIFFSLMLFVTLIPTFMSNVK